MADEVKFSKGLSTNIPSDKVPGRILIETDTGRMHLDFDNSNRIDLGSSESPSKLPETALIADLSLEASEKFNGTNDANLGVKNILSIKHGGLSNAHGYVHTGAIYPASCPDCATVLGVKNISLGNFGLTSGEGCVNFSNDSSSHGYFCASGGTNDTKLILGSSQGYSGGQINFDSSYYFDISGGTKLSEVLHSGDIIHTMVAPNNGDSELVLGMLLEVSEVIDGPEISSPGSVICEVLGASGSIPSGGLTAAYTTIQDKQHNDRRSISSGMCCQSIGDCSVASGNICISYGYCSMARGMYTFATGDYSYGAGLNCQAHNYQFICCRYPDKSNDGPKSESDMTGNLFKVGNGVNAGQDSNAFRVATSGALYGDGAYNTSGADYAEMFEWADGNPDSENRQGLLVTLDGEKIRIAEPEDTYILGAVSTNPAIICDSYFGDNWHNMYKRDVFGQIITKSINVPAYVDDTGVEVPEHDEIIYELNPEYDPSREYVPRSERKEWAPVGLLGKLVVKDDGTCKVNEFCTSGPNGIATYNNSGYRVIARVDDSHVKILIDD